MSQKKPLVLLTFVACAFYSITVHGQWRQYGFDDLVSIDIQQQPETTDTPGRRVLSSMAEHGVLWMARIEDKTGPRNEEQLTQFYRNFLSEFEQTSQVQMDSMWSMMIGNLRCLRYRTKGFPNGSISEGTVVRLERKVYIFQYMYTPPDGEATLERDHFFSSIKFHPLALEVQNQFFNSAMHNRSSLLVGLTLAVIPVGGIVFLGYLLTRYIRRKRSHA